MTKGETIWNLLPLSPPIEFFSFLFFNPATTGRTGNYSMAPFDFFHLRWRCGESMCEFTTQSLGINHGAQSKETLKRGHRGISQVKFDLSFVPLLTISFFNRSFLFPSPLSLFFSLLSKRCIQSFDKSLQIICNYLFFHSFFFPFFLFFL